jgi:hypothetical protein
MTMMKHVALALVLTTGLAACGEDEESKAPENQPGAATVNEAAVQQTASTAYQSVETAISSGDGQTAAFQMLSVGTSAFGMVQPSAGGQPASIGSTSQALGAGTCDCTANSCTFVDCSDDVSGWTINGTISWTASSFDCDYTVTGAQAGATYTFTLVGALTYAPDSLDGTLSTAGDYDVQGQSVTWDSDLTFHSVTYSGGTPTGGSIDISSTISVAGQSYAADETVTFGG